MGYAINAIDDIPIIEDIYMRVYVDPLSISGEILRYDFYKKEKEEKVTVKVKEVVRIIETYLWLGYYADEHYTRERIWGVETYSHSGILNEIVVVGIYSP